jgi:hypothetical protein
LIMLNAALGQGWIDFTSKTDFFYVNFPGQTNARRHLFGIAHKRQDRIAAREIAALFYFPIHK